MTINSIYNNLIINKKHQGQSFFSVNRSYRYLESSLESDEFINMSFIGLHNYSANSNHDNFFIYAITDNYFILAKNSLFSKKIEKINLDDITCFQFSTKNNFGIISIKTKNKSFNIAIDYEKSKHVYKLMEIYI